MSAFRKADTQHRKTETTPTQLFQRLTDAEQCCINVVCPAQ